MLTLAARWARLAALLLLPLVVGACTQTTPLDTQTAKPEPSASSTRTLHVGSIDEVVHSIARIQPGLMRDADVVAMYGPGVVRREIPDARYYTDPVHNVTLMSGWHTDHVVGVVVLTEGTVLPPGVDPALTVTSLSVPIEIDKGISLGMTPDEVIGRLGEPQHTSVTQGSSDRTLSYEVWADDPAEAGWISYNVVLDFEDERLHRLAVYSGD